MASEPKVSVTIMAHPSRRKEVERLRDSCGSLEPRVVFDPEPDGEPTALRTARLAWRSFDEDCDYHLCLQDDALPCDDFPERIAELLAVRPAVPVALFANWGSRAAAALRLAALAGLSFAPVVSNYVPTQALLVPAALSGPIADFLTDETTQEEGDDFAIRRLLAREGIEALACVPNLVDHADVPSLYENGVGRRSVCFRPDPGPLTWSAPVLRSDTLPYQEWGTARSYCRMGDPSMRRVDEVIATSRLLEQRGSSPASLFAALMDFLDHRAPDERERLMDSVGLGFLYEIWLTASAIGSTVARQYGPVVEQRLAAPGSPARAALETLPMGSLRGLVPPQELTAAAGVLADLVTDAVRAGALL